MNNLEKVLKKMQDYDIWSLTDNFEIDYHLQSYFIYYNYKAFNNKIFQDFWNNFKIYKDKFTLIQNCEIDYTRKLLMDKNLNTGVYYSA
ncbi:MAG TPA: hypothetical protein EYP60_04615, partial [bacterium (Candidatus Stahlbacteria)]|nr:hypothetical protein [Candidatus Stahlbacteria bacterium]